MNNKKLMQHHYESMTLESGASLEGIAEAISFLTDTKAVSSKLGSMVESIKNVFYNMTASGATANDLPLQEMLKTLHTNTMKIDRKYGSSNEVTKRIYELKETVVPVEPNFNGWLVYYLEDLTTIANKYLMAMTEDLAAFNSYIGDVASNRESGGKVFRTKLTKLDSVADLAGYFKPKNPLTSRVGKLVGNSKELEELHPLGVKLAGAVFFMKILDVKKDMDRLAESAMTALRNHEQEAYLSKAAIDSIANALVVIGNNSTQLVRIRMSSEMAIASAKVLTDKVLG